MASEARETMLRLRDSLQDALKHMPATGLDGTLSPAPAALANVLKWLRADDASAATFQAWCQAVIDGNAALQEQCEADLRRRGLPDVPKDAFERDADFQAWVTAWAGPAAWYADKPKHVRTREAYKAWLAQENGGPR